MYRFIIKTSGLKVVYRQIRRELPKFHCDFAMFLHDLAELDAISPGNMPILNSQCREFDPQNAVKKECPCPTTQYSPGPM